MREPLQRKINSKIRKLLKRARKYDGKYLDAVTTAIERYERPEALRSTVEGFLSEKVSDQNYAVNPHSKDAWLKQVLRSLLRFTLRPPTFGRCPLAMVTLTHASWIAPHTNIDLDLKRAQRKVRNALIGLDYIGAFEVVAYVNERAELDGKQGQLLSLHAHLLVWDSSYSTLKRRLMKVRSRFKGMLGKKHGVRIDRVKTADDAARVARYAAKFPLKGKRTIGRGTEIRQKEAVVPWRVRYAIFRALRDYLVQDFWFGSGRGTEILKSARRGLDKVERRARARLEPGYSGGRQRPTTRSHLLPISDYCAWKKKLLRSRA